MGMSSITGRGLKAALSLALILFATPLLAANSLDDWSEEPLEDPLELPSPASETAPTPGESTDIDGSFPWPTVTIPDASFLANSGLLRRARVEGLRVALAPRFLLRNGLSGAIKVSASSVTVIADDRETDQTNRGPDERAASEPKPELPGLPDLVDELSPLLDWLHSGRAELAIGAIDLIVRKSGVGNYRFRFTDVLASASRGQISIAAKMNDDVGEPRHVRLVISDLAKEPAAPPSITGRIELETDGIESDSPNWNLTAPLKIDPNAITLSDFDLKSSAAWLRGSLSLSHDGEHRVLEGDLEVRRLELNAFLPDTEFDAPDAEVDRRLFTLAPFGFAPPEDLRADVRVQLGAIRMGSIPVVNGRLQLSMDAGKTTLTSNDLTVFGGPSTLKISFDSLQPSEYSMRVRAEATAMQLDRLRPGIDQESFISQGEADVIITLRGHGSSPAALATSLNGYVLGSVKDAVVNQEYSTLLDRGVVAWAREQLSLSSTSRPSDEPLKATDLSAPLSIPCGAIRLYINDGRVEASNGLILETPDNTLYGSGYVDLSDETLGFAFRTRSRSIFDWSAISIIKYVETQGTLARPLITLNNVELAKQGLMAASSVALGPLPGLVYSLAESGVRDANSRKCDVALR
ncbi:MAG: AsmA family protein [Burkholderiaceae bacterium]